VFDFTTNSINIALVGKKMFYSPSFETLQFVTMVHKGANFRTSLYAFN